MGGEMAGCELMHVTVSLLARSVTLVGERERKVLKQVVKRAKIPPKSRIVPPGV